MGIRTRMECLLVLGCVTITLPSRVIAEPTAPGRGPVSGQSAAVPAFRDRFHDETLRIDYHHIGDARGEIVTLDQVYRYGIWAGSRTHLLDPLPNGSYWMKIYDAATGTLIFSRGFDSYFGEYQTASEAPAGVERTYHESALLPCPKAKIRFAIERRQRDRTLHEIFSAEIDPDVWTVRRDGLAAGVIVVEVVLGGDPHGCVDVAIVGEGYTAAEEGKFRADLERYAELMLGQQPYAARRQAVERVSERYGE